MIFFILIHNLPHKSNLTILLHYIDYVTSPAVEILASVVQSQEVKLLVLRSPRRGRKEVR